MGENYHRIKRHSKRRLTFASSVASVHHKDGTVQNIAQIPGSLIYGETILEGSIVPEHVQFIPPIDPGEGPPDIICENLYDDLYSRSWRPAYWRSQTLNDYLPLWLGGSSPPDKATQALTAMLQALKAATESALGSDVDEVYITTLLPVGKRFNDRLATASSSAGLGYSGRVFSETTAAAKAQGIFGQCPQQAGNATLGHSKPEELVLVIDHSRSALTAALAIADCTYEYRRVIFSPELGADSNPEEFDRPPTKDGEGQRQQIMASGRDEKDDVFVDSLRRLIAMPVEGVRTKEHTRIDHVVLSGDSTRDARFLTLLKEALGDRYGDLISNAGGEALGDVDPLYSAAGHAAFCSLNGMEI